jgi:hypothetical protein
MAAGAPVGATGRACGVFSIGLAIHAHVRLLGGTEGVVHAVAPGAVEAHPVGRIRGQELRLGSIEEARHVLGVGCIPAEQAMVPEDPEIAELGAGCPPRLLQGFVEVEALHVLALLADFELSEQVPDLVLTEAREREVDVGCRLQVREQTCQELLVPGAADLVQCEAEEACLFHGHIEPGHRDRGQSEAAGCDQALVAADDRSVLTTGQDRLDEAELPHAPFERVELVLADPAGVGRIRTEIVDRDLVDGEGGERGRCGHASATSR